MPNPLGPVGGDQDLDDIESGGALEPSTPLQEGQRDPGHPALFDRGNRRPWASVAQAPSGFDLDEDDQLSPGRDQVDLAVSRAEATGRERESGTAQVLLRDTLPNSSETLPWVAGRNLRTHPPGPGGPAGQSSPCSSRTRRCIWRRKPWMKKRSLTR